MPMLRYLRRSLLPRVCLMAVSLALFSASSVIGGFVPSVTTVTGRPSSSWSSAAAASTAATALLARRKTLYEILGASPGESQESLRRRYSELAKKTHPDAAVSGGDDGGRNVDTTDFASIAAAWSVLGDPKERMRYDRELKAKEFTDSVERLVDTGIRNTIPFLRKTANNTQAAMEKSAKIATDVQHRMREMNERMEMSRKISDVEKAKRDAEQRASRQLKQSQQMQKEIETLDDKRLNELMGNSSITASKAARLLDGFLPKSEQTRAQTDVISDLKESEQYLGEKRMGAKESENNLAKSRQQVVSAENTVKEAELRLEEAKKMLMQAKNDVEDSKKAALTAKQNEKAAQAELVKASSSLSQQMEKVRASLRTTESKVLEKRAVYLKGERVRLQNESNDLMLQAKNLGVEIDKLKKEEEELRRRQART